VKLFVQHAPAADSHSEPLQDEAAVAEICAGLHGLALAVELVAAQADQFRSPEALQRLSGLDRQRDPLRAAISWIVSLLAPREQKLFSRLSVFPGSFTAEAAEAICCAAEGPGFDLRQGLESLREKRLLRPEGGDRCKMPDVLRQLAAEFLEERERNQLKRRHFDFFLALVETVEPRLTSAERDGWLERLEAENENLRAALTWSQKRTDSEPGLRLAGALFWFWNLRAYFSEGRRWLEPALKKGRPKRTAARARALYAAGGLAFLQGDQGTARAWLEESVDLWREVGDPKRLGFALIILGMVAQQENEFETALACEKESVDIFRRLHDEWGLALALNDLGNVHRAMDDHKAAIEHYRLSLPKWRKMNDPWGLPLTLDNLGYLEMLKGDKAAAHRAFREALKVRNRVDDRWGLAETIKYLADLAVRQGEDDEAERLYRESLDLNRKIGRKPLMVGCLAGLAGVALRQGFLREAARLSGAVEALRGPVRPSSKLLDHETYEETWTALRKRSRDSSVLRRARSLGKKAGLEEITTYALALPSLTAPAERASPPPERKAAPELAQQALPQLVKTQL
jgi:non-specific serine/threonine protein kinase